MRYYCTGSSKTGTHLLLKAARLFYEHLDVPMHTHTPFLHKDENKKYIHITRHPKNTLISWLRFNRTSVCEENLIKEMGKIITENKGYVDWLSDESTLNVRFEKLLEDETELIRMSEFIGLPCIEDHHLKIWGGTRTFTGNLSDYNKYWTDITQLAWVNNGGVELEKKLGYI